jgi:hypothetical protein
MEYLAELGAAEAAPEGAVAVPPLAAHHWQQLNAAGVGAARPQLDRRAHARRVSRAGVGAHIRRCQAHAPLRRTPPPPPPARPYDSWHEEVGTLPDGRHFKNYFAVHSLSGARRLMAVAEDGVRRDRRYAYKAAPDLGGCARRLRARACLDLSVVSFDQRAPYAPPPRPPSQLRV